MDGASLASPGLSLASQDPLIVQPLDQMAVGRDDKPVHRVRSWILIISGC
jgi:hypothetical protein